MSEITAGPGTIIAFHYDLYDESSDKFGDKSNKIETSEVGEPLVFLYGQNTILASLQEAFLDKSEGDEFSVTIPAGKAYGRYYHDRRQRIPIKQIDGGKKQKFHVNCQSR